ncbi:probable indole-3-pyruvate monooxygenase YUCCA3 [Olea europaea subsp. europaea]|uniref:indole-3-pyruvate monooxygenase n=1 Tax=Olea europaea subsp. europaea TaxID=158383 RepID=A0A8S0U1Z8_OLEEU|nr:probable indole-3-pyruvate monooxygenase YUCCA3 [Olea europaea subsp. europaea]
MNLLMRLLHVSSVRMIHNSYSQHKALKFQRVVVVGCGNSGMEVSPDLCNYDAKPSMVVRSLMSNTQHITVTFIHPFSFKKIESQYVDSNVVYGFSFSGSCIANDSYLFFFVFLLDYNWYKCLKCGIYLYLPFL